MEGSGRRRARTSARRPLQNVMLVSPKVKNRGLERGGWITVLQSIPGEREGGAGPTPGRGGLRRWEREPQCKKGAAATGGCVNLCEGCAPRPRLARGHGCFRSRAHRPRTRAPHRLRHRARRRWPQMGCCWRRRRRQRPRREPSRRPHWHRRRQQQRQPRHQQCPRTRQRRRRRPRQLWQLWRRRERWRRAARRVAGESRCCPTPSRDEADSSHT